MKRNKKVELPTVDKAKNAMGLIQENVTFLAFVPWNGTPIPCEIYMLNTVQIKSCGDFNVIEKALKDSDEKKLSDEDELDAIIRIKNTQERLMKLALVHPTYDELVEYLGQTEVFKRIHETIEKIESDLQKIDKKNPERKVVEQELELARINLGFMFPDDFMATITAIVLQRDNSDIQKVSHDMLLEAACLAEKWHDRPSDHISGIFTDFQKQNINRMAAVVLQEFRKDQETAQKGGSAWMRSGPV